MDLGAVVILVILPLTISVFVQITLGRSRRSEDAKFVEGDPDDRAADALGTAGLGLLVKTSERVARGPSGSARLLDALATVGGSLLVSQPNEKTPVDPESSPYR